MAREIINIGSAPNSGDGDTLRDAMVKVNDNSLEQYQGYKLDTLSTPPTYESGRFWYDGFNFNFYDNITGTSIQLGKELVVNVYNGTGATIPNLSVVRYNGTVTAGNPNAELAIATTTTNASALAVTTHDIADQAIGKVVFVGLAGGDTSGLTVGARVFLSGTLSGEVTEEEQPILSPVGIVLVSDAVNGVLLVNPLGVQNITAVGQASGENHTQGINGTPAPITAYNEAVFELNTVVTQAGATDWTASIRPASVGASGYYRVSFSLTATAASNDLYHFEVYKNNVGTGILAELDLRNNNVDAGSCSVNGFTQSAPLLETDVIEIYAYSDGGGGTVTYTSVLFNLERIGNI